MSDFGKGTCRLVGIVLGALLAAGLTGGLDDPASPCYPECYTSTSETGE